MMRISESFLSLQADYSDSHLSAMCVALTEQRVLLSVMVSHSLCMMPGIVFIFALLFFISLHQWYQLLGR